MSDKDYPALSVTKLGVFPQWENVAKSNNGEFDVTAPNIAWVSDITYIWTNEGWLYLAAVKDLYSKKSWAMR